MEGFRQCLEKDNGYAEDENILRLKMTLTVTITARQKAVVGRVWTVLRHRQGLYETYKDFLRLKVTLTVTITVRKRVIAWKRLGNAW